MKLWPFVLVAVAVVLAMFGVNYVLGSHSGGERSSVLSQTAWQRMALPGELSRAHAFLEHDCAACHTAVRGADPAKCIACHANDESLLQRRPTAFHADVGSCRECHREHQGTDMRPTEMDHLALAEIALRRPKDDRPGDADGRRDQIASWIKEQEATGGNPGGNPHITPPEAMLDCAACHREKDHHFGLFGTDCARCHATTQWAVPEFRHPSPQSTDCAECHQAPPNHYMKMCFQIFSANARKPHAQVNQCYQCHQTTGWKDIKGAD